MTRRPLRAALFLLVLAMGAAAACGKRADPLAPYVKTPQPPAGLDVSQIGDEVEIRVAAPRSTTEGRPLPVLQLEWFQGPAAGDFDRGSVSLLREDVAPGELRTKRFPRPLAEARFSVRASNGKARSAQGGLFLFKPAPVPSPPSDLRAANTASGIELRWTNPAGAEPWPSPHPTPSPSPTPASLGTPAAPTPAPPPPPSPSPIAPGAKAPAPVNPDGQDPAGPAAGPPPGPRPTTTPTPSPTPPTGIRIFRTDGALRLAREPLQAASWLDPSPQPGDKPCYAIRYATSFKPLVESVSTEPVCVEVKDIVPPEPPGSLVGDIGTTFVELSWGASPSPDVAFYRIYRWFDTGTRALAIETQGPVLRMRDPNLARGPRSYDVVAVDRSGNESARSPVLKLIVP